MDNTLKLKTQVVAGHRLTLVEGVRYWASRPMLTRGRKDFPVWITPQDNHPAHETVVVSKLSYDAANDLINAFNTDGPTSFHGRVW